MAYYRLVHHYLQFMVQNHWFKESVAQYCLVEYLTSFQIFGGQGESVAHCRGKQQA